MVHGDFFDWYSKKAPESVIGWIGGNVRKGFRVMIDFPRRMIYWEQQIELDPHDLDQVGVTLEDGTPVISSLELPGKMESQPWMRFESVTG